MKILQVIHGYLPHFRGGTELYLQGLNDELKALGQDVSVIAGTTHSTEEAHRETHFHHDIEVSQVILSGSYLEHWTRSYSPDAEQIFRDELKRIRPDLVHVHHWFRLTRNLIETCYRAGIPVVCTLHDLYVSCPTFFRIADGEFSEEPLQPEAWRDVLPRLPWMEDEDVDAEIDRFREDFENELALAHRVIVPTKAHGELLSRVMPFPKKRVRAIPHGTITPPAPSKKPKKAPKDGRLRLGVWGHLFRMKGVHVLLEALQQSGVAKKFDLHVWGEVVEPGYRKVLDRVSEGLEIQWHGSFVPSDIEEQVLDLAVMPSLCSESYSFVLDEAFRLGLPALVSDRGALGERIGDAGLAFPPGDSKALAKILRDLAADPSMIEAWARKIPALPSMAEHAKVMLELYADVIRKRDMSRLEPDMDLPRRRTSHLHRQVMRREQRMFAYLGELKREQGRGDHYEAETKKLLGQQEEWGARLNEAETAQRVLAEKNRLLEALAREIEDFRAACRGVIGGELRKEPEVPELKEHVPGLGAIRAIVHENQIALEGLYDAVNGESKIAALNETIAFLTREILAFRSLAQALANGNLDVDLEAPVLPDCDNDLPLLGTPATVTADDNAAMRRLIDLYLALPARYDALLAALGKEINQLSRAMAQAGDAEATRLASTVDEARGLPEFEKIEAYLAANPGHFESFYAGLDSLREEVRSAREASLGAERALIDRGEADRQVGLLIEELRRALTVIHQDDPSFTPLPEPEAAPPLDLPGLGDLPTIRRVNHDLIAQYLETLRALRSSPESN